MVWPYLRRLLLPGAALYLCFVLLLKSSRTSTINHHAIPTKAQGPLRVPIARPFLNTSTHFGHQPSDTTQLKLEDASSNSKIPESANKKTNLPVPLLDLTTCPRSPNRFTGHIRIPNLLHNISMSPASAIFEDQRSFWNPTILALPHWANNQYIIVNMVSPNGEAYRRNVVCEANICHPRSTKSTTSKEKYCTENDLRILGSTGGLRCITTPLEVDVPPTPAEKCEGMEQVLADIPGFHDPKLLYSGRGEPILMVVSQSRYACIGIWAIDLRTVCPSIEETFSSSPRRLGPGPLMTYPTLTELTRNPPWTRHSYEKNWVMFSTSPSTSYIQYDLNSTTRTFAQLVGGGLTTTNLTDPFEEPCLDEPTLEEISGAQFMKDASWHQATPSLKLILCDRANMSCSRESPNVVFFAAIQRKHVNGYGLPVRYERYFVLWSATAPFNMLAVSQHPILFANETNHGWTTEEIWDDTPDALEAKRGEWGRFTYTTTIAYAWGREESDIREKGVGYLDDEVILSVGIDDEGGLYGKAKVSELLQCLRICPGRM